MRSHPKFNRLPNIARVFHGPPFCSAASDQQLSELRGGSWAKSGDLAFYPARMRVFPKSRANRVRRSFGFLDSSGLRNSSPEETLRFACICPRDGLGCVRERELCYRDPDGAAAQPRRGFQAIEHTWPAAQLQIEHGTDAGIQS